MAERQGLLLGLMLAFGLDLYIFKFSELRILHRLEPYELKGQDAYGVQETLADVCEKARLPRPRVFLLPDPNPSILSVGKNWRDGSIVLSEGLVASISNEELRAALIYQLYQVVLSNSFSVVVGAAIADSITLPARILDKAFFSILANSKVNFFTRLFGPITKTVMLFITRPKVFYELDKKTTAVTGDPETFARLLLKMKSFAANSSPIPWFSHGSLHMVNPLTAQSRNNYFDVQPAVQKRVIQLVGRYPI